MTPPEITRLEMDAAIANELAAAAKARASIATLEHQRSLLGSSTSPEEGPRAGMPWMLLLLVGLVAFAIGAKTLDENTHHPNWSASSR